VLAILIVGIIIVVSFVGYAFYSSNNSLNSLSQQNNELAQQVSVLEQRTVQVVTMTNTVISQVTTTSTSTVTSVSTQFLTLTTTRSVYPPSNSTYSLTYVSGNSTISQPSCGSYVVSLDVTYEIHQQLPPNIIQWAVFPSGQLLQPSTQTVFTNQAYLSVLTTYDYSTGACSVGMIANLHGFVTDTNDNQLSPSTYFIV
jgi:hypothetical protein